MTDQASTTYSGAPPAFKIDKILVALDFSPASMEALQYAISLARQFPATIHLAHVYPPDEAASIPGAAHLLLKSAQAIKHLNEELTGIHREHVEPFCPENCHIRSGRPYQEILKLAREISADLIVIATRGHTGLKHLLLGSTAERVVRSALCPVLVARRKNQKKGDSEEFALRTILVTTDFSECSLAAVEYAAFLANKLHATLRLLHVMYPFVDYVFVDRAGVRTSELVEAVQQAAHQEMDTLKNSNFLRDASVQTEIRPGYAVDEICRSASQNSVDLIVTSTHGRSGFKHAVIGSVAEHIVRYAECSVLVVPSRAQAGP